MKNVKWLLRQLGFHVHEWGRWRIAGTYHGMIKDGWSYQRRSCETCGLSQERDV